MKAEANFPTTALRFGTDQGLEKRLGKLPRTRHLLLHPILLV
jgi:hypothetical protein